MLQKIFTLDVQSRTYPPLPHLKTSQMSYMYDPLDGFIEEKNGSKYLNIPLTDSNNDVLIKYAKVWIKFDSDDNLPLNKIIKFRVLKIII